MSAVPKIYLTPAEYLAFERQSDVKHEYFRGELFASVQCQLPLAEVYDRVEFDQPPPAPKLSVVKEESEAYLS